MKVTGERRCDTEGSIAPEHFAEVVDILKPIAITCTAHHLLSPPRLSSAPTLTLAFKQRESPAVLCSCSGTRTTLA